MATFEQVDPVILEWSEERHLPLYTRYKDEDVRSFQVVGASGASCQIWIETGDEVSVHVWDYGRRRRSFVTNGRDLRTALDNALAVARSWIN